MTLTNLARDRFVPATASSISASADADAAQPSGVGTLAPSNVIQGEIIEDSHDDAPQPGTRVEIARSGGIQILDGDTAARETVSEVTPDTFYAAPRVTSDADDRIAVLTDLTLSVDLDAVAQAVKEAQRNGGQVTDPNKRIYTGREGEILLARDAGPDDRISEVTPDTFYASTRAEAEERFARTSMPRNTMKVSDGEYEGWHYTIANESGDSYGQAHPGQCHERDVVGRGSERLPNCRGLDSLERRSRLFGA
jgi:hypothetical protein